MAGRYYGYDREGKQKKKKYKCRFCNHKLPTLSGITSHLSRTHGKEIEEYERKAREYKEDQRRKKQEKIEQERRAKEFVEIQLKEYERMLPQIKEQNKLEIKRQEREKEQRRREEARKTDMWNKIQKELREAEVINQVRRKQKENIRKFFAYHMMFEKENPTLEDFYLYSLQR